MRSRVFRSTKRGKLPGHFPFLSKVGRAGPKPHRGSNGIERVFPLLDCTSPLSVTSRPLFSSILSSYMNWVPTPYTPHHTALDLCLLRPDGARGSDGRVLVPPNDKGSV